MPRIHIIECTRPTMVGKTWDIDRSPRKGSCKMFRKYGAHTYTGIKNAEGHIVFRSKCMAYAMTVTKYHISGYHGGLPVKQPLESEIKVAAVPVGSTPCAGCLFRGSENCHPILKAMGRHGCHGVVFVAR